MFQHPTTDHRPRIIAAITCGLLTSAAAAGGFPAQNVELFSQIPLGDFGSNPSSMSDCWGYTSPSGREYALVALRNALAVVEVTDPAVPVIIDEIGHANCLWGDVKVFGDRCYVVNECAGGMDVIDLSDVDNGNVMLVQVFTDGGLNSSHNVAIDTLSGFLYLCDSNLNGGRLLAYDLSDPDNPSLAGQVSSAVGADCHDAQIVTYTSGPNAGKQIAFCANGGTGMDIYDVTDKSNITRLSRSTYPNLVFAHQCWLSPDRQFLYLNDEADGINETVIFDVSDLGNPVLVNTYSSNVAATDHNLYAHDGFIFEAEYLAGVRIFCAEDPANPVQVGWFDTHPGSDSAGFDGVWSVYPFFASGTLIASDETLGLFVLDPSLALTAGAVAFNYPQGRPSLISPLGGTSVRVEVSGSCSGTAAPGTGMLHYDDGTGVVSVPMIVVSDNVYDAVFPAIECNRDVSWYVSAEATNGALFTDPQTAPAATFMATAATGTTVVLNDNFETDQGWVSTNGGASDGDWQRGVPVDDPAWPYDPASDSDGSGQCWLTANVPGDSDVDGGFVFLTSPPLDLTAANLTLSYDYFARLTVPNGADGIRVQISSAGDAGPWFTLALHTDDGGLQWRHQQFTRAQLIATGVTLTTTTTTLRFTAADGNPESIVEAGLDAFTITEFLCEAIPGDLDGDGVVGIIDFLELLASWGPCPQPCPPTCPADLDGDCTVGITDFLALLGNWG